jgi:plastocyanin
LSLTVRILGALALLGVAADHLYEYFVDHYSAVPTIGTLFLLDSVAAITLGLALLVPLRRMLPAPIAERVRALAAAAGILLAAASLAGLFASEVMPLFGFMEFGYRLVVVLAIVAESAAIVALGMFLVVVEPSPTRDSGCVTMVRSRSRSSERKGNMKRSLIVIAGAGIVAAGVAGVTGALSSGAGRAGAAPAAVVAQTSMPMPMPMPATTASAPGPVHMELHQRVVRVKIMNFAFMPARIEVSAGTKVVWTNEDSDPHTVTTDKPGWASPALDTSQTYDRVVTKAGTYAYHCQIHPFMHGTVIVEGTAA